METFYKTIEIVDIAGHIAVLLLFIILGTCYRATKERPSSYAAFLSMLWRAALHAVAKGEFRTASSAFATTIASQADGAYSAKISPEAGKGRMLLLPARRRAIVEEVKKFKHIFRKDFQSHIKTQGTALRIGFFAGEEEFNKGVEEWRRLGCLIEKEEAALFIHNLWVDEKHVCLIEVVFSDEGRKANSMAVFNDARKEEEMARQWFWLKLAPVFILSLFIIHWALLGILLLVSCFMHKRDLEQLIRQMQEQRLKVRQVP